MSGESLEVRPDLVGHITCESSAIRPGNDNIDLAVLHKMAAGIVNNHRMRHTMLGQFPRGKTGPLVAGARLINPDMDRNTGIMGRINRGRGGTIVDKCQPTRIAVGQNINRAFSTFSFKNILKHGETVLPDSTAEVDILIGHTAGKVRGDDYLLSRVTDPGDRVDLPFHGPGEIHGSRSC